MINTPVRAEGVWIYDADGKLLATCPTSAIAIAIATFVNAAVGQR